MIYERVHDNYDDWILKHSKWRDTRDGLWHWVVSPLALRFTSPWEGSAAWCFCPFYLALLFIIDIGIINRIILWVMLG